MYGQERPLKTASKLGADGQGTSNSSRNEESKGPWVGTNRSDLRTQREVRGLLAAGMWGRKETEQGGRQRPEHAGPEATTQSQDPMWEGSKR